MMIRQSSFGLIDFRLWLLIYLKVFYIWTKSKNIENLFFKILFYSFLLPPLAYLTLFRKIGKDSRLLTLIYYCVSIFLFLLMTERLVTQDEIIFIPGKIKFPINTLIEYFFFVTLIYQQLRLRRSKKIIVILSVFFFLFQIIYFVAHDNRILNALPQFIQNFITWFTIPTQKKSFDSIPIGIETILIFIFIFFYLFEQFKDVKDIPIYSNYFFWIAIGLLIYLGGSLFIYLMASNLLTNEEIDQYWFFTYIVETIKNLLLATAVFVYSKNPSKTKSSQALPNLDFML